MSEGVYETRRGGPVMPSSAFSGVAARPDGGVLSLEIGTLGLGLVCSMICLTRETSFQGMWLFVEMDGPVAKGCLHAGLLLWLEPLSFSMAASGVRTYSQQHSYV